MKKDGAVSEARLRNSRLVQDFDRPASSRCSSREATTAQAAGRFAHYRGRHRRRYREVARGGSGHRQLERLLDGGAGGPRPAGLPMSEDPGRWVPSPYSRLEGALIWEGEVSWTESHGPAVVELLAGQYRVVRNCLMPDGSRGVAKASFHNHDDFVRIPPLWRQKHSDGSYTYGRVAVEPGVDVRFMPDEALQPPSETHVDVLAQDLKADSKVMGQLKSDDEFARRLYAALCNLDWHRPDGDEWHRGTWRYNGGLVASLRGKGEEYINFYCSGNEGSVADDVGSELARLGWFPHPIDLDE